MNIFRKLIHELRENTWAVALVVAISMARIGQGMSTSLDGQTLLFLAENTNSNFASISLIFTGRSGGMLLGSFLFSGIMNRFPNYKPLLSLSIGFLLTAVASFVYPFCFQLWTLVLVSTIAGASSGYFECGLQSVYLKLWGEEGSRPYIHSFHFGYSIGSFLAPVFAQPFLKMASENPETVSECPGQNDTYVEGSKSTTTMNQQNYTVTTTIKSAESFDGLHPLAWPYIIMGIYITITSIILFILAVCKVEKRLQVEHKESYETRPEEPISKVGLLLLMITLFYVFTLATGGCFKYIFSIAVTQASLLSGMFRIGQGIGRGLGIIVAKYFTPSKIIIADLVGSAVSLILFSIWGEVSAYVTWITMFTLGLFSATVYSTGVTWASKETNITGTYMVIFSIGIGIGGMAFTPIAGLIFDIEPFRVMYYALGLNFLITIAYICMEILSYGRRKHLTVEVDNVNDKKEDKFSEGLLNKP